MVRALLAITLVNPFAGLISGTVRQDPSSQILDPLELKHQQDLKHDRDEGEKDVKEIAKELIIVDDPVQQARLDRIGHELADIANHNQVTATWGDKRLNPFDYDFHIVLDKDPKHADIVNAFSIPGGHIYVYQALIKWCESDDELAGILAHEISHASFRHVATLESRANRLSQWQIPLILAGLLTGGIAAGVGVLGVSSMAATGTVNGWSVEAEEAADFGGLQYMMKSHYDPTGMLTAMERLALMERDNPLGFELGIYRDHPPSQDRANTLIRELNQAGVPIRRSHVASSFRTEAHPGVDGTVKLTFGGRPLVALGGKDAAARAELAVTRLNAFFDSVPDAYEVQATDGGAIVNLNRPLIEFTPDDVAANKTTMEDLQKQTLTHIRAALFTIGSRVWDRR